MCVGWATVGATANVRVSARDASWTAARRVVVISFLLSKTAYEAGRSGNVPESVLLETDFGEGRAKPTVAQIDRAIEEAIIRLSRLRLFCARASSSPRRSVSSRCGGDSSSLLWRYSAGSHQTSPRSSAMVIAASRME